MSRTDLDQRRSGRGLLVDRLVLKNHAGDELRRARRREQELPVVAPACRCRCDLKGIETLRQRRHGLIRGEDSLAAGHEGVSNLREVGHGWLPSSPKSKPKMPASAS